MRHAIILLRIIVVIFFFLLSSSSFLLWTKDWNRRTRARTQIENKNRNKKKKKKSRRKTTTGGWISFLKRKAGSIFISLSLVWIEIITTACMDERKKTRNVNYSKDVWKIFSSSSFVSRWRVRLDVVGSSPMPGVSFLVFVIETSINDSLYSTLLLTLVKGFVFLSFLSPYVLFLF